MVQWKDDDFFVSITKDRCTNLQIGRDRTGNTYLLDFLKSSAEEIEKELFYLYTYSEKIFPDTINFHSITCSLTGRTDPLILIPSKDIRITNISAIQNNIGISLLGIYINNNLELFIPLKDITFNPPLEIKKNNKLEIKIRPIDKRVKITILVEYRS